MHNLKKYSLISALALSTIVVTGCSQNEKVDTTVETDVNNTEGVEIVVDENVLAPSEEQENKETVKSDKIKATSSSSVDYNIDLEKELATIRNNHKQLERVDYKKGDSELIDFLVQVVTDYYVKGTDSISDKIFQKKQDYSNKTLTYDKMTKEAIATLEKERQEALKMLEKGFDSVEVSTYRHNDVSISSMFEPLEDQMDITLSLVFTDKEGYKFSLYCDLLTKFEVVKVDGEYKISLGYEHYDKK